jgi:hypothetical protein
MLPKAQYQILTEPSFTPSISKLQDAGNMQLSLLHLSRAEVVAYVVRHCSPVLPGFGIVQEDGTDVPILGRWVAPRSETWRSWRSGEVDLGGCGKVWCVRWIVFCFEMVLEEEKGKERRGWMGSVEDVRFCW